MRKKLQKRQLTDILQNRCLANFTGKYLCWSLFLIKLQIWRFANLLRRDSKTGVMRKKLQKQSSTDIFFKKGFLKNFANFTGKYLCRNLFLIKLQVWRHATLLRRDFNTGVFLWYLRNFLERLYYRTPPVATFETKHMLQLPFYYLLEQEISTGMRAMRKKLNLFMLQLPIYYILE